MKFETENLKNENETENCLEYLKGKPESFIRLFLP